MRNEIRLIASSENYFTKSRFDFKIKEELKVKEKLTEKKSEYETPKISFHEIKQEQSQQTSKKVKF